MAGTNTITYTDWPTVKRVHMDWLSTAGGLVNSILTKNLAGVIVRFCFVPDDGGTAPDQAGGYTVLIVDADGLDVLAGDGAGLSNTVDSQIIPILVDGIAIVGTLELQVTNAGNAKGGQITIYLR